MARGENLFSFGQYTFASWARRGIGNSISANGSTLVRGRVPLNVALNNETITQDMELLGPADVAKITHFAIVRTSPIDRTFEFEWNMLPYIEFYDEDFLWRYTPDAPENGNLRPWLALAVLKVDEFTELPSPRGELSAIRLQTSALPPSSECHLWAHMHTGEYAGVKSPLEDVIKQQIKTNVVLDPDGFTCRLLSPRRLEPKTMYHAFLIPAFESGRLAGLGEDYSKTPARQPAWQDMDRPTILDFPFYHRWSFATSESSFEDLISRIKKVSANPNVGVRVMDASLPGYAKASRGVAVAGTNPAILGLEGALRSPKTISTPYPIDGKPDAFQQDVEDLLALYKPSDNSAFIYGEANMDGDPILTIPLYGQPYTAAPAGQIPLTTSGQNWYSAINFDPRNRVAAALGTQAVQKRQEELMQSAWHQLAILQNARNNFAAVGSIMDRLSQQMAVMPSVEFVSVSRHMIAQIKDRAGTATAFQHLSASATPNALINSASRRMMRPGGALAQRLSAAPGKTIRPILSEVNKNLNAKSLSFFRTVRFDLGSKIVITNSTINTDPSPQQQAFDKAYENFIKRIEIIPETVAAIVSFDFDGVKNNLLSALKTAPTRFFKTKINLPIQPAVASNNQPPAEIIGQPVFTNAMYEPLWQMDKEWFLPNLHLLENNTLTLLETNPHFIHAYMLGLNQELGREMLWRGYPADLSATFFRHFWPTSDGIHPPLSYDIEPIQNWLGSSVPTRQSSGQSARLVMTLRGDVLRKFPNTVIFAAHLKRDANGKLSLNPSDSTFRFPIFRAEIPPDLQFVGFDLSVRQVLEISGTGGNKQWYFVFMETLGEPRFGLDAVFRPNNSNVFSRNDLAWEHLGNNEFLTASTKPSLDITDMDKNLWGKDAATMAAFLFQQPFATLIKATDLLSFSN